MFVNSDFISPQPVVSDIDGDGISGEQMCRLWAGLITCDIVQRSSCSLLMEIPSCTCLLSITNKMSP